MTVGELLAMFGVKDPEALAKLESTLTEMTKSLASWGERARHWFENLDPSTRELLLSFSKAQAVSNSDTTDTTTTAPPWWTEATIPYRSELADPDVTAEMEAMKARMIDLEAQFKKATGRSVPDAFPPPTKKDDNDPN